MRRIAVLFPGQGSQRIGMLDALMKRSEKVSKTVLEADSILGYKISKLIKEGPSEELNLTQYTQPALVLASYCHWQYYCEQNVKPDSVMMGHSIGEITALAAAEYLPFEDALRLAALRGEIMGRFCARTDGGMLVVKYQFAAFEWQVNSILADFESVGIAIINSDTQLVISGPKCDLIKIKSIIEANHRNVSLLLLRNVQGAFHSPLMMGAGCEFAERCNKILMKIKVGATPVISNYTAVEHTQESIVRSLVDQIRGQVRWRDSMKHVIDNYRCTDFLPLGPGRLMHDLVDNFIDEATSEFLPGVQEDISRNLEICDLIKSRQVNGKEAMRSIKRRLQNRNPNIQMLALALVDACVKNTGLTFLKELASREFIDCIESLCKADGVNAEVPMEQVKQRAIECFQIWALMLGDQEGLHYIREVYELLKREGVAFPPPPRIVLPASVIKTEAPPEWTDSVSCQRCNVAFSIMVRKHHCRQCGKTFCQDCTSKTVSLPEMGLYEDVRVCESCYGKRMEKRASLGSRNPIQRNALPPAPKDEFQADLEKAIQLSLQETKNATVAVLPAKVDPASKDYDEEAALAEAIAASLETTSKPPPEVSYPKIPQPLTEEPPMLISPLERENIFLFAQLISQIHPGDSTLSEPEFLKLTGMMAELLSRMKGSGLGSLDISQLISSLEESFERYDQLTTGPANVPGSNSGSVINMPLARVDTTKPSEPDPTVPFVRNIPEELAPVMQPMKAVKQEDLLIPDLLLPTEERNVKKEDPLAELEGDISLIQL